jgi:hypothetical protein
MSVQLVFDVMDMEGERLLAESIQVFEEGGKEALGAWFRELTPLEMVLHAAAVEEAKKQQGFED